VSLFEATYTYTVLSRTRRKYQIPTCTLYTAAPGLLSPNIANHIVLRNTRSGREAGKQTKGRQASKQGRQAEGRQGGRQANEKTQMIKGTWT
jgi:hypothetical protein